MAEETPLKPNEIYEKITGGPGSDSLADSTNTALQLHGQLLDRASEVKKLSAEIGEGWQGPAGEAAAGATLPLAKAAEADGENLGVAGGAIEQQVTDFGTVRNSVVPVSPTKPEMTDEQAIDAILGGDTGAYDRSVADWRDKGSTNVQAFSKYHQASGANGERLPRQYEPLTDPGYPISQSSGNGPGSGDGGTSGVHYVPGDGGRSINTPNPNGPPTPGGGIDHGSGGQGFRTGPTSPPGGDSVHTPAANWTPPATGSEGTSTSSYSPDTSVGGRPGTGYTPGGSGLGDHSGGAHRSQTSFGPYGSSGAGFGSGGYGGRSVGGSGSSAIGGSGSGYGAGRTPGAVSGSAPPGAGRSSGVIPRSPNGTAGARVGTISGGAAGGSAGTGRGMMPMGAGAGRGQGQNEQHERKTPYVENTNELFGPDHRGAVPEVIGEVRKKR